MGTAWDGAGHVVPLVHRVEFLKALLVPSNACLLAVALGMLADATRPAMRLGRRMATTALIVLLVLSSGWTSTALLSPLERAHTRPSDAAQAARAIVVLGAYGLPQPHLPLSSWPNDAGLFRVVEAIHLKRRCQDCLLYVSGNSTTVEAMTRVLESLGDISKDVELDGRSQSTAASARNLADRLRGAPFHLVTSAGHMPRAMLAFRSMGLEPLAAPTDFRVPMNLEDASGWPTPQSLRLSDLAIHEYLGILWYRMRGM